jgi:large subunit ribosomal protein L9
VATNVKVLLKSEVVNLGSGGEIVKVRAGYARNFLLPRGLALPATDNNLKKVEELKREAAERAKAERDAAQGVPIKTLGSFEVIAKLHSDVQVPLKVEVVKS